MLRKTNYITFTTEKYFVDQYTKNPREEKRALMWRDIAKLLQILTSQGYVCTVRDDDTDIIVVEYDYDNYEYGGLHPIWCNDDEVDLLDNYRLGENDEKKEEVN